MKLAYHRKYHRQLLNSAVENNASLTKSTKSFDHIMSKVRSLTTKQWVIVEKRSLSENLFVFVLRLGVGY